MSHIVSLATVRLRDGNANAFDFRKRNEDSDDKSDSVPLRYLVNGRPGNRSSLSASQEEQQSAERPENDEARPAQVSSELDDWNSSTIDIVGDVLENVDKRSMC